MNSNKKGFKLGRTSEERQRNFEEMVYLYNEKNFTLEDIAKRFNVSKQAINQFMVKRGFIPYKEKDIKHKQFRAKAKNTVLEEKLKLFHREKETQRIEKIIAQTKAKKYKQALKEIKEITESEIDSKEFMAIQCILNGSVDNKNKVLKQILQKINEVIDEH